jgi:adenylate cyclase
MRSLSERGLARQARASLGRIRRLVEIGVLRPDDQGNFKRADIQRVQIVAAYERGGIGLDDLAQAVRDRRVTFEYSDRIYPEASPPSGRTIGDLMDALGPRAHLVLDVYTALGLPRPDADRPVTRLEEKVLPDFFEAWTEPEMSADALLRAARLLGDATRRAAEGWTDLFMEAINLEPDQRSVMSVDALGPRLFEPATRVAGLLEPMAVWLLRRHMEQALNALNVETMERALELYGLRTVSQATPAIVFADLSGFTRLTDEQGDQLAVHYASTLSQLAATAAAAHSGRLVKQLGDGVMLAFSGLDDAIQAALDLHRRAEDAGLPPLHTGVSAGPLIERDGDYFGRTVNLASRISAIAAAGEILTNQLAANAADRVKIAPIGATALKGFAVPVPLFRLDLIPPTSDA